MGVFKKKESSASAMIAPSGGGVPPAREPTKLKQSGAGGGHPAKVKSGYKNMDSSPAGHPADDILARGDNGYKYITEALGTFFLFLVGTRVGTFTASLTLAALTFMAARISKAHFNPAITAAHFAKGAIGLNDSLGYILWQVVGATSGALAAATYFDAPSTAAASGSILDLVTAAGGLVAPTFLIALTHIAVLSGISRTEFFGLAIGFALSAAVTAYGPGGNLFNPALGIGSWMAQGLLGGGFIFSSLAVQLINLIVQALAGALAALLFKYCAQDNLTGELLTEAIGTFVLVILVITTADSPVTMRAQAVGLGYAAITFFGAEISEAHYNPAVTIAHLLLGDSIQLCAKYMLVQLVSAIAAGLLGVWYTGLDGSILSADATDPKFMVALVFGAALLCLVHMHVLASQEGNGFFGLAIGFTLLADKVVFHTIFNPAAAIGIWVGVGVFGSGFTGLIDLAVLVIIPLLGAGLAAVVYKAMVNKAGWSGVFITEAVGIGCIILTLLSTAGADHSEGESFGGDATDAPAVARRRLVFGGGSPTASPSGLDDGLLFAALAYMGQYISNAHFNPAITIAHAVANMLKADSTGGGARGGNYLGYLGAQVAAGVVFALAGGWLYDVPDMKAGIDLKFGVGLVLASFLICLVHLNTAMSLDEGGNGYFGLAIGFAMFAAILSFGDTESALFNPAVAIGITAAQVIYGGAMSGLVDLALLLLLPLVGAALAALAYQLMCSGDAGVPVTELIGTFLIVLTLIEASGSVGLVACAATYMGGAISGAHFNPAISFTHYLNGDLTVRQLTRYVIAQTVAATLAGVVGRFEGKDIVPTAGGDTPLHILSAEVLFSFVLCLIHLNVLAPSGVKSGKSGNGYFGLAMGFALLAGFVTVGSVSGGIFNPATGLGLFLAQGATGGGFALGALLYYLLAPPLGAKLAQMAYQYQHAQDMSA